MPDCDYCSESFGGESDYLDHLAADHEDELGPIDRRKVENRGAGPTDLLANLPTGPIALVLVIAATVGVIVYVTFFLGGSGTGTGPGSGQPYNIGSVHYHGTMEMSVLGDPVDFSQDRYQFSTTGVRAFHFEGGGGRRWHAHAQGVTLHWAMQSLGINVTRNTVTFEGTIYRDSDPNVSVAVTVNGQSVTPSKYVLREGDQVRIAVTRA